MRRIFYCTVLLFVFLCWHAKSIVAKPEMDTNLHRGNVLLASTQEAPRMKLLETAFDFQDASQGSVVSHEFIVWNTGNAVLRIEQVGPTCECLKADFDESIPPGGAGKITLTLHLPDEEGPLERTVAVITNDPENSDTNLSIRVTVKQSLSVYPGKTSSL
ncbi:MAG: DUF1573 domain-containing protein [Syntrophales bacterium LBB04]|nr:DUF1573 domain-containing protein [Syntrophales bacterium LBB04]